MDRRESKNAVFANAARPPATGSRWMARLAQAKTEAQLIRACRRYLISIRPFELARLPLACRPIPLEDAADLSAYALQLVRYHCEVDEPSPLVLRMASFFAHANVCMAKMLRRMNDRVEAESILASVCRPPREPDSDAPPAGPERTNAGAKSG